MPKINSIIGRQAFEIIRDRLADIFIDEISNQFTLTQDAQLKVSVSTEKKVAFDKTELPRINFSFSDASFQGRNVGQSDGIYNFNCDIFISSPDTDDNTGDAISSIWCEKLLGIAHAIFSNSAYITLGFPNSTFIHRVEAGPITIGDITQGDARNTIAGRVVLTVKATQPTSNQEPILADGYDTVIKISNTEGFFWSIDNYL